ncbi:MAG: hypothetical protein ACTSPY_18540, partial [Candidatus Helarchaeota archaeon]
MIDKNDEEGAIAGIGIDIFGLLESNNSSFPIQSLYSPIFWTDNGNIPNIEIFLHILEKTPIKVLLTFSDINPEIKNKIEELGIKILLVEDIYDCKTIDLQVMVDNLLDRRTYFNEIILMPKDKFLNISLAPIFGRLGTKIMIFNPK